MQGLATNEVPANQKFCPLEKLSKSDKSYLLQGVKFIYNVEIELTLTGALCQFIGRLNKGDDNDWYQEKSEGLHFDFAKYKRMREVSYFAVN